MRNWIGQRYKKCMKIKITIDSIKYIWTLNFHSLLIMGNKQNKDNAAAGESTQMIDRNP